MIEFLKTDRFAAMEGIREIVRKNALKNSLDIFGALACAKEYTQLFDFMKILVNDSGVKLAKKSLSCGPGSALIEWPTLLLGPGWFGEYAGNIGIDGSTLSAEPLFSTKVENFAADPELPALAEAAASKATPSS